MADNIVIRDSALPGVFKDGPLLTASGKVPLTDLDTTGAVNTDVITLVGGVWTPAAPAAGSADTASNLGAGSGVFASKVGADFQFKSLIAGSNITLVPTGTDITISSASSGILTKTFTSPDQVITSGGPLTIAHGMGVEAEVAIIQLRNTTGEFGYVAGDKLFLPIHQAQAGANCGVAITTDATNIFIRYGNTAQAFIGLDKTTGANVAFTNTNWSFIVKVYA